MKIAILSEIMSLLDRYPLLSKTLLRPIANMPLLSGCMGVLTRAYLGATAFEIHDVDVERGRIAIGGVDEIIWSSKFLELFHRILAERVGEEEKNRILYQIGRKGGHWEVSEALKHGRWVPAEIAELVAKGKVIDTLRADPTLARFFGLAMKMVLRLIINEGGWGPVEIDLSSSPIRITLTNSQEARWLGPAEKPVCHLSAGVMAGYTSGLCGEDLEVREVRCHAMGASTCLFEIDR